MIVRSHPRIQHVILTLSQGLLRWQQSDMHQPLTFITGLIRASGFCAFDVDLSLYRYFIFHSIDLRTIP
jgi:hypothetical protein